MTIGLRKSWQTDRVREDGPGFSNSEEAARDVTCFHHEDAQGI